MSFLVAAALAVGLLVVVPVLAHLLRRSRAEERDFPAAHLVPKAQPVARQRSRLEDRALLSIRALMVVTLAVLGATPLVRCSRLAIARDAGGSVALALIVDDSLSMRAKLPDGTTRFERAVDGARQLLATTREGDAVAIVLAGSPARLVLAATTDLAEARRTLSSLRPTDRSTDLEPAIQIARSLLKQLPHIDRRVALLSDMAGGAIPAGAPPVWAPLAELRQPIDDCAVISADGRGRRIALTVACSSAKAAQGRSLEIEVGSTEGHAADAGKAPSKGDVVASVKLEPRAGEQLLSAEITLAPVGLEARLTGEDAIETDDLAPVAPLPTAASIGVLADPAISAVTTGGPTVIEQALEALAADVTVRPMTLVPEDSRELSELSVLVLDDPAGLTPEARGALSSWIERGGVAAAWLGPRAESVQLGTTLEPFVRGSVRWKPTRAKGIATSSVGWLGTPGSSLAELSPRGRAELEGALPSGMKVIARWDDQQAWAGELAMGRGLVLTLGLPASVDQSDLALRPGFLALLDHVIERGLRRAGARRTQAGVPWVFDATSKVDIEGPDGALRSDEPAGPEQKAAVPSRAGRYRVVIDGAVEGRIVTIESREVTTPPEEPGAQAERVITGGVQNRVDVSSEAALVLLLLFSGELALRGVGRFRRRRSPTSRAGDRPSEDRRLRA